MLYVITYYVFGTLSHSNNNICINTNMKMFYTKRSCISARGNSVDVENQYVENMIEQIDKRSRTDSRIELHGSHPCVLINLIIGATC